MVEVSNPIEVETNCINSDLVSLGQWSLIFVVESCSRFFAIDRSLNAAVKGFAFFYIIIIII